MLEKFLQDFLICLYLAVISVLRTFLGLGYTKPYLLIQWHCGHSNQFNHAHAFDCVRLFIHVE